MVRYTKLLFITVNEVKDNMKGMNEIIKWYELGGGTKVENNGEMKLGQRENLENTPKYPDNVHHNWPPFVTETPMI